MLHAQQGGAVCVQRLKLKYPVEIRVVEIRLACGAQAHAELHKMSAAGQGSVVLIFIAALIGVLGPLAGCVSGEVSAHADGRGVTQGILGICRARVLKSALIDVYTIAWIGRIL